MTGLDTLSGVSDSDQWRQILGPLPWPSLSSDLQDFLLSSSGWSEDKANSYMWSCYVFAGDDLAGRLWVASRLSELGKYISAQSEELEIVS